MTKTRLVAALDFGTHGTGFAWAFVSERERDPTHRRIFLFDEWTGQPTSYVKNLSALLLDGSGEVVDWGYEADHTFRTESRSRPDLEFFHRFKMGLLDDDDAAAAPPGRTARELITAYLRCFREVAVERIVASSGVTEEEIAWYVTVPAIWRDRQRRVMRECAAAAGFPAGHSRLRIAVEPEVAALYCRYDSGLTDASELGNRFMVVDAGGGTVDITAYEVAGSGLTEIGYTSGGSHGSTYVDRYLMETLLVDRLGQQVVDRAQELEPGSLLALQNEWERAKRTFDPEKRRPILLPFSYRLSRVIDDAARDRLARRQDGVADEIVLTPAEVTRLFDHAIDPLLALVDDQLRRIGRPSVETILLVGGFAQCAYLAARLRAYIGRRARVIVPGRPSTAVLLGAVQYGLDPGQILGRRSRFTYGIKTSKPFDETKDPPPNRFVDALGRILCRDRFDVFVHTGEIVAQDHRVQRVYLPAEADQRALTMTIYSSTAHAPRYATEVSCEALGELTLDISGTLGRPVSDRGVSVDLVFGGTEIEARAVDPKTGSEVSTTLSFERKD